MKLLNKIIQTVTEWTLLGVAIYCTLFKGYVQIAVFLGLYVFVRYTGTRGE